MKYCIFSIKDSKVGFGVPYADQTLQSAVRGFSYMVNGDNVQSFAPADFSLYHIANFDSELGILEPLLPPVILVSGDSLKRSD